jgi:predicted acylesterase/phospholipase RssA
VATDLKTAEKVVLTNGSIARAVQEVARHFTPTEINKKILADGGVASQVP